mmetsp:Transcript_31733/g.52482  ORF Transcript_31733/g.52482 Transcript_31733/m.52482 type:complete len:102 (+) Transcript_31733:481-786(+)
MAEVSVEYGGGGLRDGSLPACSRLFDLFYDTQSDITCKCGSAHAGEPHYSELIVAHLLSYIHASPWGFAGLCVFHIDHIDICFDRTSVHARCIVHVSVYVL